MDLLASGGRPLEGVIRLSGAKNMVPKAMVASLLTPEPLVLENVPAIRDTQIVTSILAAHGVEISQEGSAFTLQARALSLPEAPDTSSSRIPLLMAAPLLHRLGEARVPLPGGCQIGTRPIDFHLSVLSSMGARIQEEGPYLHLTGHLHAADITLPYPSVGATEQALLAASLAEGTSTIRNAAMEPEIIDLILLLQSMGSPITLTPDRTITVTGRPSLEGATHHPVPDRLEAASWGVAAALTGGTIEVQNARAEDMTSFLGAYQGIGGRFEASPSGITFLPPHALTAFDLTTDVYPGLSTDWQPPLAIMLTQAEGTSLLHETVYEDRLGYTTALRDMGAEISLSSACLEDLCRFDGAPTPHVAAIRGATPLSPARLLVPDLRAGFSYIVAALAAPGTSRIDGVDVVYRGYEAFPQKLLSLGADIALVPGS